MPLVPDKPVPRRLPVRSVIFLVVVAIVVIALLLRSSSSPRSPIGYGLATAGANDGVSQTVARCSIHELPCPSGDLELAPPFEGSSAAASAFAAFRSQVLLAGGRSGYMRLWVPYDTVSSWQPSADHGAGACGPSRYATGPLASFNALNGTSVFRQLVWNIQAALALGLTPEVVFSAGSGEGTPHFPDPGYGDATTLSAGLTTAGLDYYCGVGGVIGRLRQVLGSSAPTHWEAFNEPDGRGAYLGDLRNGCAVHSSCGAPLPRVDYNHGGYLCGRRYAYCGPLEAAELWELAEAAVDAHHWGDEQIAALSMIAPESSFGVAYIQELNGLYACAPGLTSGGPGHCSTFGRFPRYWAVHDYDDPTAGGTADLQAFENRLSELTAQARAKVGPLQVWVTESGVELNSTTRADLNRRGCAAPGKPGSGTLGACVNDRAANQARGALAWRALLDVHAPGMRTTQVYWFEFELIPVWDSALVDASGRARASLCALVSGLRCDGNPTDYLMRGA